MSPTEGMQCMPVGHCGSPSHTPIGKGKVGCLEILVFVNFLVYQIFLSQSVTEQTKATSLDISVGL